MQQTSSSRFSPKLLAYGALLAALAIVFGRATVFYLPPDAKYTLDKFVLFMSGMFFGPVLGAFIGFVADFLGGLLFGIGFTPQLCVPAIVFGLFGGLFQKMLKKKFTLVRLGFAYLFPTVIGAILYQSAALALTFYQSTFWINFKLYLLTRSIQFAIMLVLEVSLIYLLLTKTNIFSRAGLWPALKNRKGSNDE